MKTITKKGVAAVAFAIATGGGLAACASPADVASQNISQAADNYQIARQVSFIDTITGQDIVSVQGLCSLGNDDVYPEVTVTCKTGPNAYIKDFFEVTPTTTVATIQLGSANVSTSRYRITWNPGTAVPDFNSAGGAQLTSPSALPSTSGNSNTKAPTKVVVVPVPQPSPKAGS